MMVSAAELRAVALSCAERGWSVFPLWPGTKFPALHKQSDCPRAGACREGHLGWEQRATTDPDRIRRCWTGRAFNVGIATGPSNLVVLDLDMPKAGQTPPPPWNQPSVTSGEDVFLLVCAHAGHLPPLDTYTVATPSGGRHLYYTAPAGARMRSTVGGSRRTRSGTHRWSGFGWKIDTRADKGQVLAVGSHIRGRSYTLVHDVSLMELPSWMAALLAVAPPSSRLSAPVDALLAGVRFRSGYAAAALRGEIDRVLAAQQGCRNDTLNAAAYALGHRVQEGLIPKRLAHDALMAAGFAIGLSERECESTINSGLSAGASPPRGASV
jgi:hypothetical protein